MLELRVQYETMLFWLALLLLGVSWNGSRMVSGVAVRLRSEVKVDEIERKIVSQVNTACADKSPGNATGNKRSHFFNFTSCLLTLLCEIQLSFIRHDTHKNSVTHPPSSCAPSFTIPIIIPPPCLLAPPLPSAPLDSRRSAKTRAPPKASKPQSTFGNSIAFP